MAARKRNPSAAEPSAEAPAAAEALEILDATGPEASASADRAETARMEAAAHAEKAAGFAETAEAAAHRAEKAATAPESAPYRPRVGDVVLYNRATDHETARWLPLMITHVVDATTVDGVLYTARPRAAGQHRESRIVLASVRGDEYREWQPRSDD